MARHLTGLRILLVEDEPLLAWELEAALIEAGATVIGPATTLAIGCALAQQEDLAAAVLDVQLGKEQSDPIAEALHEQGVPFVFHTGNVGAKELAEFWSAPVITKPSTPDVVVAHVAQLVRSADVPARL
jgi:DNA-binding response OmpR family regulator